MMQPKTNKNIWLRFASKVFTIFSTSLNSAAVTLAILDVWARLVVANDSPWLSWRNKGELLQLSVGGRIKHCVNYETGLWTRFNSEEDGS